MSSKLQTLQPSYVDSARIAGLTDQPMTSKFTRSSDVARIADRTAWQHTFCRRMGSGPWFGGSVMLLLHRMLVSSYRLSIVIVNMLPVFVPLLLFNLCMYFIGEGQLDDPTPLGWPLWWTTYLCTTAPMRMLSKWPWISRCRDYWQQVELCTDGACRIMMMMICILWQNEVSVFINNGRCQLVVAFSWFRSHVFFFWFVQYLYTKNVTSMLTVSVFQRISWQFISTFNSQVQTWLALCCALHCLWCILLKNLFQQHFNRKHLSSTLSSSFNDNAENDSDRQFPRVNEPMPKKEEALYLLKLKARHHLSDKAVNEIIINIYFLYLLTCIRVHRIFALAQAGHVL